MHLRDFVAGYKWHLVGTRNRTQSAVKLQRGDPELAGQSRCGSVWQGGLPEGAGYRRRRCFGLTVGRVWLASFGTLLWAEGVLVDANLIIGNDVLGTFALY